MFFAAGRVRRGSVRRASQGSDASLGWRVGPNIAESGFRKGLLTGRSRWAHLVPGAWAVRSFLSTRGALGRTFGERHLRLPKRAWSVWVAALLHALLLAGLGLSSAGGQTSSGTFRVDYAGDLTDALPGDGSCATVDRRGTLRAAIVPARRTINLPAGTYEPGIAPLNENDIRTGDLDVTDALTIAGAGAATTVVDGGPPCCANALLGGSGLVAYRRLGEATATTAVARLGAYPRTYRGGFTLARPAAATGAADTAVRFDGSGTTNDGGGSR
jgi:hypothetical protein